MICVRTFLNRRGLCGIVPRQPGDLGHPCPVRRSSGCSTSDVPWGRRIPRTSSRLSTHASSAARSRARGDRRGGGELRRCDQAGAPAVVVERAAPVARRGAQHRDARGRARRGRSRTPRLARRAGVLPDVRLVGSRSRRARGVDRQAARDAGRHGVAAGARQIVETAQAHGTGGIALVQSVIDVEPRARRAAPPRRGRRHRRSLGGLAIPLAAIPRGASIVEKRFSLRPGGVPVAELATVVRDCEQAWARLAIGPRWTTN